MTWWAIQVAPGTADPAAAGELLARLSGQAVLERTGGGLVGYAPEHETALAIAERLRQALGPEALVALDPVEPVDWRDRWRDGIRVRRVGRLEIGPSWLLEAGPGRVVVDPETAFGTGEHGSTRGALALLDRHLRAGDQVLDAGSGSGILAIAAVRLGASRALGVESDADAEPVASANARRNGVETAARFVTGDAAALLPLLGPARVVVSNILRETNASLLPAVRASLAPDGVAIFAGMERAEREQFLSPLRSAGFEPVDETEDEGWWAVAARAR